MPKNGTFTPYDDEGFPLNAIFATPITLGQLNTVKASAGRLVRITVTTVTAAAVVTVYDNASAASGTILAVVPIAAAVGTIYLIDMPALNGITVQSTGATGAITVGYS
jgi:hypothetical protein